MKKIFGLLFLILILIGVYFYKEPITTFILDKVVKMQTVSLEYSNSYYLNYKFNYVQAVDEFNINNKQDLMNLYYTIINSGNEIFDFYCPREYKGCIEDVKELANNPTLLSTINGYVHPFNSFDTVETIYDSLGRVNLTITKTYSDREIELINEKVEEIVKSEVKDTTDKKKIIRIIHDYIISHTKYDKDRTDKNIINYLSNTAYGVLFQGYGICSGYADAMAIFLDYFDIPNYKIASENHVWNAVYIDNNWYHLDLTWDDPIMSNGSEIVDDTYFLITTEELKKQNDNQHFFDTTIYSEFA